MKKNLLAALAMAAISLGSATPAQASNATPGNILDIWAMPNGSVMFNHSGGRTGLADCQSRSVPKRWALDGSTPAGQARIAALLTAYSLGKPIFIWGSGICTDWNDTETVTWFAVADPANGNGTIL